MSISSDEVNFLVYRYLQESGEFLQCWLLMHNLFGIRLQLALANTDSCIILPVGMCFCLNCFLVFLLHKRMNSCQVTFCNLIRFSQLESSDGSQPNKDSFDY